MRPEDANRIPSELVSLRSAAEVTIRPLCDADGEALSEFYDAVPEADRRFYAPHPLTHDAAVAKAKRASDPRFVCLVAVDDEQSIAGYAWYQWTDDAARESGFGICVRPSYQGTGLGRALMSRICAVARWIGPPVMSLTVQKANERAFSLYQSMGFEVVREQLRESDGEPEYCMELQARPTKQGRRS